MLELEYLLLWGFLAHFEWFSGFHRLKCVKWKSLKLSHCTLCQGWQDAKNLVFPLKFSEQSHLYLLVILISKVIWPIDLIINRDAKVNIVKFLLLWIKFSTKYKLYNFQLPPLIWLNWINIILSSYDIAGFIFIFDNN